MDIFSMQCFLSAAETLNLSKAAIQMHITQPAMSVQIKKLEKEIGATLFERDSRKMILTPAGQMVQKTFSTMVGSYHTMLWQVRALSEETKCLRVGYHGPYNWAGINDLFQKFLQENPGLRVNIQSEEFGELKKKLEDGQMDLIFLEISDLQEGEGLKWYPLFEDYGCYGVSKDHPLAEKGQITPQDAIGQKIYMNHQNTMIMEELCQQHIRSGIQPEQLVRVQGTESAIALALAYGGMVALPRTFKDMDHLRMVCVDNASDKVHLKFGLVWRADNETAEVLRFIQSCKEYQWPKIEKVLTKIIET